MEMKEFVKAQRTYNVRSTAFLRYGTLDNLLHFTDILIFFPQDLLIRYNPLHDMTAEERVKATTRRVGLEQPAEYDDSDPANRENKD